MGGGGGGGGGMGWSGGDGKGYTAIFNLNGEEMGKKWGWILLKLQERVKMMGRNGEWVVGMVLRRSQWMEM